MPNQDFIEERKERFLRTIFTEKLTPEIALKALDTELELQREKIIEEIRRKYYMGHSQILTNVKISLTPAIPHRAEIRVKDVEDIINNI